MSDMIIVDSCWRLEQVYPSGLRVVMSLLFATPAAARRYVRLQTSDDAWEKDGTYDYICKTADIWHCRLTLSNIVVFD
jgi:hypothetical protein